MENPHLVAGPLVRAIYPDRVAIWTEWNSPCDVFVTAEAAGTDRLCAVSIHTVMAGGRHYALAVLSGLEAATWYDYQVTTSAQTPAALSADAAPLLQCFRTLDPPDAGRALRLAYGSCRKLVSDKPDALNALGPWLLSRQAERETAWPHLLLLIGDQIYADDPPPSQAQTFEDFARLYVSAWADKAGARQVFATIPTWMIFDDHEITNNWNITPAWQAQALHKGFEPTLVDGLVAYWLYQGWGNICPPSSPDHELLALMQQAVQSGEDVLDALRTRIGKSIQRQQTLQWDYTIPTTPPIFVADVRADRSLAPDPTSALETMPRIMSTTQMDRLRSWLHTYQETNAILVSSVPALLPPAIGLAEYLMGVRPLQTTPLRRLGRVLAARQQRFSANMGFEHWSVFHATWHELVALFAERRHDLLILSGDVHFSYAVQARLKLGSHHPTLYQLVASPFYNALGKHELRLVLAQSWVRRIFYGRLFMRVLPLKRRKESVAAPAGMLLQNALALVTFSPHPDAPGRYTLQHVYLGVHAERLQEIGASHFPTDALL